MRRTSIALVVLAAAIGYGPGLAGIYVQRETQLVPVARLAANIQRQLEAEPKNGDLHLRLARLYGMAFAMNADEVPVTSGRGGTNEDIWFGYEPELVPHQAKPPVKGGRAAAARDYLRQALEHYRATLAINPSLLAARLGYAWCLDQSGDKAAAIPEYRRVIEQAWPKEQNARGAMPGQRFYTQETAGYLLPLLDAQRDAAEIAELRQRLEKLRALPRAITPIAIPLADGLTARDLADLDATVPFDADGTGLRRRWTWLAPRAGWLVYDPQRKGTITSALQLFGNVSFWLFWNNGYEPLAALDDDRDGSLRGSELRYLAVWHDVNANGITDRGEVRPLAQHGIVSLSCRWTPGDGVFAAATSRDGVRFADGRTRPSYDVILRLAASVSAPAPRP